MPHKILSTKYRFYIYLKKNLYHTRTKVLCIPHTLICKLSRENSELSSVQLVCSFDNEKEVILWFLQNCSVL